MLCRNGALTVDKTSNRDQVLNVVSDDACQSFQIYQYAETSQDQSRAKIPDIPMEYPILASPTDTVTQPANLSTV